MTKSQSDGKLSEPEAEERFKRILGNLVNTPHKPHKPKGGDSTAAPAPNQAKEGKSGGK